MPKRLPKVVINDYLSFTAPAAYVRKASITPAVWRVSERLLQMSANEALVLVDSVIYAPSPAASHVLRAVAVSDHINSADPAFRPVIIHLEPAGCALERCQQRHVLQQPAVASWKLRTVSVVTMQLLSLRLSPLTSGCPGSSTTVPARFKSTQVMPARL